MVGFLRYADADRFIIETSVGDAMLQEVVSKKDIKVFYGVDSLSVFDGCRLLVDAERFDTIYTNDLEGFPNMDDLKIWVSKYLLVGDYGHQELVAAPVRSIYRSFDFAPCKRLLINNQSGYDVTWHMGNEDRAMLLRSGERIELTGISNANQVYVKAVDGAADSSISGLITF